MRSDVLLQRRINNMATASMVLGIIAICIALPMSFLIIIPSVSSFILAILALIFGIISLKHEGSNAKAITGVATAGTTMFLALCRIIIWCVLLSF